MHELRWIPVIIGVMTILMMKQSQADNWNVDGMHGEFVVSGDLISAPCYLAPGYEEQFFDFGVNSTRQLTKVGAMTPPETLLIVLEGCPESLLRSDDTGYQQTVLQLSNQSTVRVTLHAEADSSTGRLFALYGTTTGLALRVEDRDSFQFTPGMKSRPQILTPGRNEIVLNAQLIRTSLHMEAGEWASSMGIELEYE